MKKIESFVKWFVVILGYVLVLWFSLLTSVHYLEKQFEDDLAEPMWLSRTESLRLMRYHGTNGLKITNDRVYIFRDGKWIPVIKRKPA